MRVPPRTTIALALAVSLAAVAALTGGVGHAAGRASWARISGPTGAGIELGLARTSDGVLHVIWNRGNPAPTSIFDTRISPGGKTLGTTTVVTNFGGAGGLALLVMPDGTLRLFATGDVTTGSPAGGFNTFTAPASGTAWSRDQGLLWGGAGAAAAPTIGAALTKDGQPVTSWAGFVKVGLDTSYSTTPYEPFMGSSLLATDGVSGAVVLSGEEINDKGGTWVQQVLPSVGPGVVLPSATRDGGVSGLSARLGAPGVYAIYEDNTRVGVAKPTVRLYRYGGPTRTIAAGQFTTAKVFAGPAGRLWLTWGDSADGMFVTRTNRAAGALEPVQKLKLPAGTSYVWGAQGEGSAGPLDLFADLSVGNGRGFWHTHVLARDVLRAAVSGGKGRKTVTFTVSDAGDPVPGALVAVVAKGRRTTLKTNGAGKATMTVSGSGRLAASATAAGYAAATASVRFGG
jgi:hypothetical protein